MKKSETARLKARAWKLFSEYIRRKSAAQDGSVRCYTCGIVDHWKNMDCGHGIGGRGNFVLFLEEICRPQCKKCNIFLSGNYESFIPKLIIEYGIWKYSCWTTEAKKPFKRQKSDYMDIIDDYTARLAEMNSGMPTKGAGNRPKSDDLPKAMATQGVKKKPAKRR